MPIYWLKILYIGLLFPTLSLYAPLSLRVDLVFQVWFLVYISYQIYVKNIQINSIELILFLFLILVFPTLGLLNIFYIEDFDFISFFKIYIQLFLYFAILLGILRLPFKINDLMHFYKFVVSVSLFISIYGIYQIFSFNIIELPYDSLQFNTRTFAGESVKSYFYGFSRPSSIFKEPSHFGFFLQISLIIILLSYQYGYRKHLGINLLKTSVILVAFISTIGLFSFLSMLLVLLLFGRRLGKVVISILFIVALIAVLNDFLGPFNRILDLVMAEDLSSLEGSAIQRIGRLIISLSIWMDNFWIGVGLHNIGLYTTNYFLGDWFIYDNYFVYSNSYLTQILAESGILGFMCIAVLFIFIFDKIYKNKYLPLQLYFYKKISLALLLVFFIGQDLPLFSPYRLHFLILVFVIINIFKSNQKINEA